MDGKAAACRNEGLLALAVSSMEFAKRADLAALDATLKVLEYALLTQLTSSEQPHFLDSPDLGSIVIAAKRLGFSQAEVGEIVMAFSDGGRSNPYMSQDELKRLSKKALAIAKENARVK